MQRVRLLSLFPTMPAFTTLDTRMKPTLPLHAVTKPSAGSTLQRCHLPTGCEDTRASEVCGKGGERKEGSCPAPLPCTRGDGCRHLPAADGWWEQVVKEKADTSQRLIVPVSSFMNGSQKVP